MGIMESFSLRDKQPAASEDVEVLQQQSAHAIPSLLRATRNLQLDAAITSITPLIGLGPGLTPSGDDFLIGYLTGLWCTAGHNPSRMRFLTALGSELSQAAQYTNEISGTYLRSAVKGYVSEPIARLTQQLTQAHNTSSVRAATQAALQVGHTSGHDGVFGLLLGCLAWQDLPPYRMPSDLFNLPDRNDSTVPPKHSPRPMHEGKPKPQTDSTYDSTPGFALDLVYNFVFQIDRCSTQLFDRSRFSPDKASRCRV